MGTLDWQSDNLVVMAGPVVAETGLPPSETPDGGVYAKLYDTSLDTSLAGYESLLTEDYDTATSLITVRDGAFMDVASVIDVQMDANRTVRRTVDSKVGNDLTLSSALGDDATTGNLVTVVTYPTAIGFVGLKDQSGWEQGMTLEIVRGSSGGSSEHTVQTMDQSGRWMNIPPALSLAADVGDLVKRKVGADVTMVAFGTFPTSNPTPGDETWGFRGTIDHDHAELQLGMRIRAEITYEDGSVNIRRKVVGTVINR
jgi:hypothetical protein